MKEKNVSAPRAGVMLDIGRKYFAPGQIRRLISELASRGMNFLQLHFSEDAGFGIEVPGFEWLPGRDGELCTQGPVGSLATDGRFLSCAELRGIAAFAAEAGVEIIPSFDSPGHLNFAVARFHDRARDGGVSFTHDGVRYEVLCRDEQYHFFADGKELTDIPEPSRVYGIGSYFSTDGRVSRVCGTNNHSFSRGIDLANPVAVAFVEELLDRSAGFFRTLGCRAVDIGGDELLGFVPAAVDTSVKPRWGQLDTWADRAREITGKETAVAYDMFVLYMNRLYRRMRALGYDCVRTWNDEFMRESDTGWKYADSGHVQFEKGFAVQFWSAKPAFVTPCDVADRGHRITGADSVYCYYVLTEKARSTPPQAYVKSNPESIEKEWDVWSFGSSELPGRTLDTASRRGMIDGWMTCVWCDRPDLRTDAEVIDELLPMLDAFAKKVRQCGIA